MKRKYKIILLLALSVFVIVGTFLLPPYPQPAAYHIFADNRKFWIIPNASNVLSNVGFLLVGIVGLRELFHRKVAFIIAVNYQVLFCSIILTGIGSAWYHLSPDNTSLVWDRIPMTFVFMSLLAATIAELINRAFGTWLLIPLVLAGVCSVLLWHLGDLKGKGDLRFYGLVQFYPVIFIPLILFLFYDPVHRKSMFALGLSVVWYLVAKVLEYEDRPIYKAIGISGHTLKHFAAALSTWYLVVMFRKKYQSIDNHE